MDACFKTFDKDEDNSLNINEFTALLKALFRNEKGKPYPIDNYMANELFMIFNQSGDGSMSKQEFAFCWNNWIKRIVRPVSALIVVDVQNDFISGSLAISNYGEHQGEEVVPPINKMIETIPFNMLAYSLDWHPKDHLSFVDNVGKRKLHESSTEVVNGDEGKLWRIKGEIQDPSSAKVLDMVVFEGPPRTEQVLWPAHCVQNTWGAELHKDLKVVEGSLVVRKGESSSVESYSAFFDSERRPTELARALEAAEATDLYVAGLAYDVCVGATTLHALELGFRTYLVDDASRGINMDNIACTKQKVKDLNGAVINSSEVKALVQGRDRRVELGYQLALQCRKMITYPIKNKNSRHNNQAPAEGEQQQQQQQQQQQAVTA